MPFLQNLLSRIWTYLQPPSRPILTVRWPLGMMMHDTHRGISGSFRYGKKVNDQAYRQDVSLDVRRPNPLVIKNVSTAFAFNIAVEEVVTPEGKLVFATQIPVLNPGEEISIAGQYLRRDPPQPIPEGIENFFLHQAFQLTDEQWAAQDYLEQELTVNYNDYRGYAYWTKALLRYQSTARSGYVRALRFQDGPVASETSNPKVIDPAVFESPNPELKLFAEQIMQRAIVADIDKE